MTETKIPMDEKITATIAQRIGGTERFVQCTDQDSYFTESQERIGFAVGQAVRGILDQQRCGSPALFWIAFLKEMLPEHAGGGEWVYKLKQRAEEWWELEATLESGKSFAEWMLAALAEQGKGEPTL